MRAPYRYDYVGSFLRPEALKEARSKFENGTIDAAALKDVEDACITDLVKKQKQAGYHFITDGEFRRTWCIWIFSGDLMELKKWIQKMDYISMGKQQRIKVQRLFLRFLEQIILSLETLSLLSSLKKQALK